MTASQSIVAYLEAVLAGNATDTMRHDLATRLEGLLQAIQKARAPYDQRWYSNQRFIDGEHFLVRSGSSESGRVVNLDVSDDGPRKKVRRTVNLIKVVVRGIKNFVLKLPLTVEVAPESDDETAIREAQRQNDVAQGLEYELKLRNLMRAVVHDGFVKYAGNLVVLPTPDGFVSVHHWDNFDVYPDPTAPDVQKGRLLFLTSRQNVQALQENDAYENTSELRGDGKFAYSEFKDGYERSRQGSDGNAGQSDLDTAILKQLIVKLPVTARTGPDGKSQELVRLEGGQHRFWIVTFTSAEIHRLEETTFTKFPDVVYYPEQNGAGVFGDAWITDLKAINKAIDNLVSIGEEWHRKATPKLLVPSDSKLKEVKSKVAEVLEYDKHLSGDGIKDFMPHGLPESFFRLIDMLRSLMQDIGGLHEASSGRVPVGVKAARAIEELKASDAEFNIAEPLQNFGLFYQEVFERMFEVLAENQREPKTITYPDGDGVKTVKFMGRSGLVEGTDAPEDVVVVKPSKVRVNVTPEVSFTEEGKRQTLLDLYKDGVVDRKTVLEAYRIGNVQEVIERVRTEQMESAKQPPPPKPVDADKLLNALANLSKSGEPITLEQLNAAMLQAGLPPIEEPTPPPAMPPTDGEQGTFDVMAA